VNDFTPIKLPRAEVIREALDLYQTAFRKASFTVYDLDFSGSMRGAREQQLKSAMRSILDQELARKNLLQAHPNDVTAVIVFDSGIINETDLTQNWVVRGNDPARLKALADRIESQSIRGGTNIYQPVVRANQLIRDIGIGDRFPAIILMSDGESERGTRIDLAKEGLTDVPVFTIRFGEAGEGEMVGIGQQTHADSFDGRQDLTGAFRKAKGYN
jgi:Ca-activated chloride channel family protein